MTNRLSLLLSLALCVPMVEVADASSRIIYASSEGVVCDGKTDNTGALLRIFQSEVRGVSVVFPPGECLFRKQIPMQLNRASITGAGGAATILVFDGENKNDDIISIRRSYGSVISHFGIWSRNRRWGGAALHVLLSSYITIEDMHINDFDTHLHSLWTGVWIDQPNFVTVSNVYVQAQKDALLISAKGVGTPYQYDVFVNSSKFSDSGVGVHVAGGIDNVHLDTSEVTSNINNFIDDNSIFHAVNQEIYIGSGVVFDQSLLDNVIINDRACNRANYGVVSVGGVITHAKHGSGIVLKSFPNCELTISSPLIAQNQLDGIELFDRSAYVTTASSVFISDNGRYGEYYPFRSNRVHFNAVLIDNKKTERADNNN